MAGFHKLTVSEVLKETSETVSICFEVPDALKSSFEFKAGQYLTLKKNIGGKEIRRSYSICSGSLKEGLRVAVKEIPEGVFSGFANNKLKKGDELEVMEPNGNFTISTSKENKKHYVFFAAGSGITPVISLIKNILSTEEKSHVSLFFGNKGIDSIIFRDELDNVKNSYVSRFSLSHIFSREGLGADINKGRIDSIKCEQIGKVLNLANCDEFFMCGPEEMILSVKSYLEEIGIEKNRIHFELFTTASSQQKMVRQKASNEDLIKSSIKIILDGNELEFALSSDGETILDTALNLGADLPFACKGGVCCTCKAKLLEGEVQMDVNYALEDDEVANGFILTCQSHPTTDRVVVDFDQL